MKILRILRMLVLVYSGESRNENEWESSANPYNPQTFNTEHVYPQVIIR
jgi:hypothetical protein